MIKKTIIVTVEMNHEVSFRDLASYVRDSIESWQGSLFPGDDEFDPDPMWGAVERVQVKPIFAYLKKKR